MSLSSRPSQTVFLLGGVGIALAVTIVVACTGGETSAVSASGRGGASGSAGGTGVTGSTSAAAQPPTPPTGPVIECGDDDGDGGDDVTDAGSDADAAVTATDAGVIDSDPCTPAPPDDCIDTAWAAHYTFGRCTAKRCEWDVTALRCTKGCFRQIDGGDKCNQ